MDKQHLSRLFDELEPILIENGYELLDLRFVLDQGRSTLRVFIDRLSGASATDEGVVESSSGVSVGDCSRVSRLIDPMIDVADVMRGRYLLEVSSPGLDRPLRRPKSFERVVGSLVKVRMNAPIDGQRNFRGELLRVDRERVWIKDDQGREHGLLVAEIDQANVVFVAPDAGASSVKGVRKRKS